MLSSLRSLLDSLSVASLNAAAAFTVTGSLPAAIAVMILPVTVHRLRAPLRVAGSSGFRHNAV